MSLLKIFGKDTESKTNIISDDTAEQGTEICKEFLEKLLYKMGEICEVDIEVDQSTNHYEINIIGGDAGKIIGQHGKNLEALRTLAKSVINHAFPNEKPARLDLDIEGYLAKKREEIRIAVECAFENAKASGKPQELSPMSPYERLMAHEFTSKLGGSSESVGTGKERRVKIAANS